MASAIISGLLSTSFPASQITVSEPWEVNREKISAMGVNTTSNNLEALVSGEEGGKKVVDFVFLAVKPQVAKVVCKEIGEFFAGNGGEGEGGSSSSSSSLPVLVSIAAGITAESIRGWVVEGGKEKGNGKGGSLPVVRVMPNTPALLGEGASGLYAGEDVSAQQKELVTALLKSVSRVVEWVDREELLDVVTGLSGSGPVSGSFFYFFRYFFFLFFSFFVVVLLLPSTHSPKPIPPNPFPSSYPPTHTSPSSQKTGLLLRPRRTPHHQRHPPRPLRIPSHAPRHANLFWRRKNVSRIHLCGQRISCAIEKKCHEPQWYYASCFGEF